MGYVSWVETSRVKRNRGTPGSLEIRFEIEGAEVKGTPINPPKLKGRVVRAEDLQGADDFIYRIAAELGRFVWDRQQRELETLQIFPDEEVRAFELWAQGTTFDFTGVSGIDVVRCVFTKPQQTIPESLFLPQTKRRKQGLILFGVRKTRSNAANFASFRVPHK